MPNKLETLELMKRSQTANAEGQRLAADLREAIDKGRQVIEQCRLSQDRIISNAADAATIVHDSQR